MQVWSRAHRCRARVSLLSFARLQVRSPCLRSTVFESAKKDQVCLIWATNLPSSCTAHLTSQPLRTSRLSLDGHAFLPRQAPPLHWPAASDSTRQGLTSRPRAGTSRLLQIIDEVNSLFDSCDAEKLTEAKKLISDVAALVRRCCAVSDVSQPFKPKCANGVPRSRNTKSCMTEN